MNQDRTDPVPPAAPVAGEAESALDRLIADGLVSRPIRRGLPAPLVTAGDDYALTRALAATRSA